MITLLVPTMNRSDFLIRFLRYYEEIGFKGCICIGDGSSPEHVDRTKRVIETLRDNLNIVYMEFPDLKVTENVERLFDLVSTPYAAFLGDDDFLIPSSINKCMKFLEEHPDYAAAHGKGISISLDSGGEFGRVIQCGYYPQPVMEAGSASQRLDDYMSHYSVILFSVHRIESWRMMIRDIHLLNDRSFGGELLPCCTSVILGKSKELDCLYLVRQDHAQRYLLPLGLDWVASPEWYPSYLVFRDGLAKSLALQDNISLEEAQKVVKQAFCAYLVAYLSSCSRRSRRSPGRWLQVAWKIPGARQLWQFLHTMRLKKQSVFSLPALLDPSSPYHADFMPVYKALTTPPIEFSDKTTGK